MNTDFLPLRTWLADQENFEANMRKSPWTCTIKDNNALTAVQMLEFNNKVQPSSIVVVMPDGSFKEFWWDVYENQQNVPYDIRLPTYSEYFLIY
jgi:hypothetical protein